MKRVVSCILCTILLLSVVLIGGCAKEPQTTDTNDPTRTVVDMKGKTVTLPETVDNYCVLYSSAVGLCGMMDEGYKHVSILPNLWVYQDWVYRLFPNLPEQAIQVNKRSVTAEQIIEEGAQVVFWSNQSEELIEALEDFGIACINVAFTSDEELIQAINIIADVFGTDYAKNMATKYCDELQQTKNRIIEMGQKVPEGDKRSVLFLGSIETPTSYGKPSYEYGWSVNLNINYVMPEDENVKSVDLTMEQILDYDPDIIIVEAPVDEAIYSDPVWSELKAVKNGKLVASPYVFDVWPKSGVESIVNYKWAFATIYPEYAADMDMEQEIKDFFKTYFNYSITDDELASTLAGRVPEFK